MHMCVKHNDETKNIKRIEKGNDWLWEERIKNENEIGPEAENDK